MSCPIVCGLTLQDVNTGRVLVLKRSSLQSHEGRVVYEKEASVMRTLAHPNIVQVGCRGKQYNKYSNKTYVYTSDAGTFTCTSEQYTRWRFSCFVAVVSV